MLHKADFLNKIADVLRDNGIGKELPKQKTTLHITSDNGDAHDFRVVQKGKVVPYSYDDLRVMCRAIGAVIEDSIKRGETVYVPDIGKFAVHKIKARHTYSVNAGEVKFIPETYTIRFTPCEKMQKAVQSHTEMQRFINATTAEDLLKAADEDDGEIDDYGD